jgi:hypothetical protein
MRVPDNTQTGELRFDRKPHRMTSPPANDREWLEGYEGVMCRLETDPMKIAVLCREATWGSVFDFHPTAEQIEETWEEIQTGKVLGAAFEIPAFAFVFRGSRVAMDQLLRLRESAGAAHTTRDNDFRDWNQIVPMTVAALADAPLPKFGPGEWSTTGASRPESLYERCQEHVEQARELYGDLVDAGVPPQDARYIALPMGYQGDWVQVMNLRALIKEMEHRLCNGLVQPETNYLARIQRDLVVGRWPEMAPLLRSRCEKVGQCTSGTMLFPKCGAFGGEQGDSRTAMERSQISYSPELHLYPPEQNSAMEFAEWDRKRSREYVSIPLYQVRFAQDPDSQSFVD